MIDNRITGRKLFFVLVVILIVVAIITIPNSPTVVTVKQIDTTTTTTTVAKTTVDPVEYGTSCKHVSVEELDQWFHSKQWNSIPKIIHQTWKNKTLRERQARWSRTWCDQYTNWRYHLWTDEENDLFVKTKFPWFYPTFQQLSPAILRADSVRYLYMYYYGGLYIDLDYESIRRADELFANKNVVLSLINYSFGSMNSVPNSWMVSRPRHPLWTYVSHRIMLLWSRVTDKERKDFWNGKAEFFTGPQSLFEGLMFYLHSQRSTDQPLDDIFEEQKNQTADAIFDVNGIAFLGPQLINAFDWMSGVGGDVCSAERPTFDEAKCKEAVKPIYAITYWSHSYGHGHESDPNYLGNQPA